MSFLDYYAILGIAPDANADQIKRGYRASSQLYHPDVNKAPGADVIFKQINQAYEVLSNASQRRLYDEQYSAHVGKASPLEMQLHFSRTQVAPLDKPQLLYVLAKLKPVMEANADTNAPLNICIIVDRSKSMQGSRLRHVKNAAHRLIEESGENDIVSVVTFSDFAEVVVPPQRPTDRRGMKALISTIRADGATAMYEGLQLGLNQVERYRNPRYVNHIVLITDGRTYGDEDKCLELAEEARDRGIGISGMGIGQDWNDNFLDNLTSRTGGSSAYINSGDGVTHFLHERIKRLSTSYAERTQLVMAPTVNASIQEITRVSPDPLPLAASPQPIALGTLDGSTTMGLVFKLLIHTEGAPEGPLTLGRIIVSGEVLGAGQQTETTVKDVEVSIVGERVAEEPPPEIIDALSKLRLYQLQQKAREAVDRGDFEEATRHLNHLATRLLEDGHEQLAQAALHEARSVSATRAFSEEGAKELKYGTRALISFETQLLQTAILASEEGEDD